MLMIAALVLAGCGIQRPSSQSGSESDLVKAAKQEGMLTTIALPHDWCNYGEIIQTFKTRYGLHVNELNPDASSAEEIEAVKANKNNKGPQAPDVLDIGFGFAPQLIAEGLAMPYKVSTWDTIPDNLKHPEGYWVGGYYGILGFEVAVDFVKEVPRRWSDLLKPEYKGKVALAGDPRASNQAIMSVAAAALAMGGSFENPMPGLEFFKRLNEVGNFVPVIAKAATIASGETPIVIRWDYLALADRDKFAGNPKIEFVVPEDAPPVAGLYVQAISAYAPHPNAAKLWQEFLYSDEGQLLWLKGYCHPIRYQDLVKRGVVPPDLAAKLPPAEAYARAIFPTLEQQEAAKKVITENWDKVVGVDVK
ncbi:ABC transporter substrate-binding protein [Thermoflexus sp.]|uniref:ABC transporter substrate-binding protein n=1 Tax=Thermoflexus sp. TaxID=1969742 RepID=UPI003A0FCA0D